MVVQLPRRLPEIGLWRRLIHITNNGRLVYISLRRRLIVDFRRLRHEILLRVVVSICQRRSRNIVVCHYRSSSLEKTDGKDRINLVSELAPHSIEHGKLCSFKITISLETCRRRRGHGLHPQTRMCRLLGIPRTSTV